MRKKILALSLTLLTAFSLFGCGKSDNFKIKHEKSNNHSDFFCYKTADSTPDENGNVSRTFYFINEKDNFELTYKILKNFTISDFYCGSALITNDSYGYNRYMVVDEKGYELIPYDTYSYMERIGNTKYFIYSTEKDDNKYGIVDENNNSIIDCRYSSIKKLNTDKAIIYLCNKENDVYDICSESGSVIKEDITIFDTDACQYYVSMFSPDKTGIIVIQDDGKQTLISEKNGNTILEYAENVSDSILNYYKTSPLSGEIHLCMIADDGTKLYNLSDDYLDCNVFAIKGFRYVYNSDGIIVAKYSGGGRLTEKSKDENIIHPIVTNKTKSLIIEHSDRYSVKNSTDKEVAKFKKDTYELVECTDYGFVMKKDDSFAIYDAEGKLLYDNVIIDGDYKIDETTYIYSVGGHIIKKLDGELPVYENANLGIVAMQNISLGKFYLKDETGVLSEYDADKWIAVDDSHGYPIIQTTEGYFNQAGELMYTE